MIAFGQEWHVAGHVVACIDVTTPRYQHWQNRLDTDPPHLVYADPPWNDGVVKQAYKLANLPFPPTYAKLMQAVWRIGKHFRVPTYVEASATSVSQARVILGHEGGHVASVTDLRYARGVTSRLIAATWGTLDDLPTAHGHTVHNAPHIVLAHCLHLGLLQPGQRVFDPLCGPEGDTAIAAHSLGLRFIGCEINPVRAQTVIDRLARYSTTDPTMGRFV